MGRLFVSILARDFSNEAGQLQCTCRPIAMERLANFSDEVTVGRMRNLLN